jgi:hypothetical protein
MQKKYLSEENFNEFSFHRNKFQCDIESNLKNIQDRKNRNLIRNLLVDDENICNKNTLEI